MKKGTCAMAGFAVSTLQRFIIRRGIGLSFAKGSLAFVFLGTVGAHAQFFQFPIANPGPDQTVDSGATVTLDGSASTPTLIDGSVFGSIDGYYWEEDTAANCDSVPPATATHIKTVRTAMVSFTAEVLEPGAPDVTYCFRLRIVASGAAYSQWVGVRVTVEAPPNADPVAEAGDPATWNSGVTVTLDGSDSSDSGGSIATWAWTRSGGTMGLTVADLTGEMPTFTADTLDPGAEDVEHTFTLTVTDDLGGTDTDTVTITINAPPKAVVKGNAARTVASGAPVTLDGSDSSDSTGMLTYAWTRPGVDLTGETASMLTFTAPTLTAGAPDVTHTYTLTVTDEGATNDAVLTDAAVVTITVESPNAPPVASVVTTTREFASGTTVELVGRGTDSDSDDETLAYAWDRTGGTGNDAVTLTGKNTDTLSFTADTLVAGTADKTHILELVVTDTKGAESDPVEVTITITAPFAAPNAVAVTAESEYVSGATVTLASTGSSVDRRRGPISYTWARTGGTEGVTAPTLTNGDMATATFTAETLTAGAPDVTHTFTLTVTDSTGATDADTVEVTITAPFADPVARAVVTGGQTTLTAGETVTLDGSGSTKDRRRTITTYAWAGETAEVTASLTDADMDVATEPLRPMPGRAKLRRSPRP